MFVMVETLHLKRLEDTQSPFKDLAITPGHKKVIWSLVHFHFEKRKMEQAYFFHDISQDIIHNKGKGLVLLLDEADVFRSQRQASGLQRNSLVSVFLRVLEYYSGILFLTTNRVGNMGEAFESRIHINLYYPP
ncbi:Putative AAA family ATPase [Aspergillus calidoustus]|uniref:Putative AAA family ATPase n=1 Tax=Aspergillus calidoustus TaxID=454130 RepID=A0A0U5GRR7_ASPCI|nr:Putative AAA family ATPase [Aspergillus calidoustus]